MLPPVFCVRSISEMQSGMVTTWTFRASFSSHSTCPELTIQLLLVSIHRPRTPPARCSRRVALVACGRGLAAEYFYGDRWGPARFTLHSFIRGYRHSHVCRRAEERLVAGLPCLEVLFRKYCSGVQISVRWHPHLFAAHSQQKACLMH